MEKMLRQRRENQYKTNVTKKIILKKTKFKVGDTVCYLKRRSKFSKEASLIGNWSDKLYKIQIDKLLTFIQTHAHLRVSRIGYKQTC